MGGSHAHGGAGPRTPRPVRIAVLAVIVPVALITLAAVLWMWPDEPEPSSVPGAALTRVDGTIVGIDLRPCPERAQAPQPGEFGTDAPPTDPRRCGTARVELTSGDDAGRTVTVQLPSGPGTQVFGAGDDVVLLHTPDIPDGDPYQLSDHDRTSPMWLIGAAFALAVIAFGRLRGLTALLGLAITFLLLLKFLIPAILAGQSPLLVAIVCAAAIMLSVLYLTHGFSMATSIAVIGTIASLSLTGLLATVAIDLAHLSGITDEASLNLDLTLSVNSQGLLLASIIIGALGVLDDVTVTQAATVTELAHANPAYRFAQLYKAGARIGRAHIASVINTVVLAYAGASLPLLLLLTIGRQPLADVLTGPAIGAEIVRSVAGTLGLIAAVPITTALAALLRSRGFDTDEHDEHTPVPSAQPDDLDGPGPTRMPEGPPTTDGTAPGRPRRTGQRPVTEFPPPSWPGTSTDPFR
ncbi:YibE/F family protein [Actinomadura algeriensis]|uniref:Membrane protein n=1 Tax=Actinomadura algeriensis TaxID=1679523 RepID=A0ABR9K3F1_9ACTN|nr:YibE/F family protein [Actinomadura algeriensis]MBE1537342.1 putative membrane protein [Actinomadura algeriensis]